jgi:hypothetical protein
VWRVLRKRLHLQAYKLSIAQDTEPCTFTSTHHSISCCLVKHCENFTFALTHISAYVFKVLILLEVSSSLSPPPRLFLPSWCDLPRRVRIMRAFSCTGVETFALQIGKRWHRLSPVSAHNFCGPFIFLCSLHWRLDNMSYFEQHVWSFCPLGLNTLKANQFECKVLTD